MTSSVMQGGADVLKWIPAATSHSFVERFDTQILKFLDIEINMVTTFDTMFWGLIFKCHCGLDCALLQAINFLYNVGCVNFLCLLGDETSDGLHSVWVRSTSWIMLLWKKLMYLFSPLCAMGGPCWVKNWISLISNLVV